MDPTVETNSGKEKLSNEELKFTVRALEKAIKDPSRIPELFHRYRETGHTTVYGVLANAKQAMIDDPTTILPMLRSEVLYCSCAMARKAETAAHERDQRNAREIHELGLVLQTPDDRKPVEIAVAREDHPENSRDLAAHIAAFEDMVKDGATILHYFVLYNGSQHAYIVRLLFIAQANMSRTAMVCKLLLDVLDVLKKQQAAEAGEEILSLFPRKSMPDVIEASKKMFS